LTEDIEKFIKSAKWIFAKTYEKTWPHEYTLLKDAIDKSVFFDFVKLINTQGYKEYFYTREQIYYKYKDMVYWTMDKTIEETNLINRVHENGTYEARLRAGTLPERSK